MPALVIPQSGLVFEGSPQPSKPGTAVPNVFGLTLMDSVIEEMIACYNNGKPLQLSLGEHPSLQYGTKTQHLATSTDPFPQELYRTSTSDSESQSRSSNSLAVKPHQINRVSAEKPHPQFLAMFAPKGFVASKKNPPPSSRTAPAATPSIAKSTDAALAALQSSLASENAKKAENTTKYIKDGVGLPVPSGRRGGPPAKATSRSKLLSQNRSFSSDTTRSGQSSGTGSPSLGPTSVPLSQQQAEQAKATRKPVVHLLALGPTSEDALRDKIPHASSSDLKQALQKVGDLNQSTGKWELRRNFYKELDVWSYDYETSDDRQRAIDNAVKQYDKLRLGVSEPQWDRLLPKAERGTGKCLSKLQAQIAQGPVQRAPKINVQKAEDSGRDTSNDGDEDLFGEKKDPKAKGESTARPSSQPSVTKTKKVSEQAAQAKRLLSKTKPKPAPIKKAKEPKKPAGKVLSSQFVSESDEEDDYMTTTKAEPNPMKRSREDEEETSDSSTPLSKKVKESHNHRVSDASQSSRATTTSTSSNSNKAKGNSPQKSSPLASSPPTNASDIESYSGHTSSSASPAHPNVKVSRSPIYKRHQKSSSVTSSVSSSSQRSLNPKVVDLARRYRSFYPKYEALHREVANSEGRRNIEREQELLDMHERLSELKKQILAGIIDVETAPASLN